MWKGGTAFPVDVLKDVCSIVVSRNKERILADHLPDYHAISTQPAHQMLKGWIEEKGDDATLDSLFQVVYEAGLLDALERDIERRIEQQTPAASETLWTIGINLRDNYTFDNFVVGIRSFDPQKVTKVIRKCGEDRWYDLGGEMGFAAGQMRSITEGIAASGTKLKALFDHKCEKIGVHRATAQLVEACKNIANPIIGRIEDDFPGSKSLFFTLCL